jgi:hypothetical protein
VRGFEQEWNWHVLFEDNGPEPTLDCGLGDVVAGFTSTEDGVVEGLSVGAGGGASDGPGCCSDEAADPPAEVTDAIDETADFAAENTGASDEAADPAAEVTEGNPASVVPVTKLEISPVICEIRLSI